MILRDNKSTITKSYCYYSVLPTYLSPSQLQVNFKSTSSKVIVMPMYDDRTLLNKYSTQIHIENQHLSRADCMKLALKKLRNDKNMRKFIHDKSTSIKNNNPNLTYTKSIMTAVKEWKKNN